MRRVKVPERLHSDIESPAAEFAESATRDELVAQLPRWIVEAAVAIEARNFAVATMHAENAVEAIDFRAHLTDRAAGDGRVVVPEREVRKRAHDLELPIIKLTPWRKRADTSSERGHDRSSRGDSQEPPPGSLFLAA